MKQTIVPARLVLGEPCRVIDSPIAADEAYLDPHRHEYWELIWCLDSVGSQQIDFVEYPNKIGRFFTISPGQVHRSGPEEGQLRLVLFASGFVETNIRSTRLVESVFSPRANRPPYLDCSPEAEAYLLPIYQMIQHECERGDACDWSLVESLLNCLLRYLLRYAKSSSQKGEERDPRVALVVELIEQHYRSEKSCEFYAQALALTNKRINEIVKGALGKTVTQLIHDRVILEANRELIFSNKTIKTIAFELGFADPAYFSRFYRGCMKETPAQFRYRCSDSATL